MILIVLGISIFALFSYGRVLLGPFGEGGLFGFEEDVVSEAEGVESVEKGGVIGKVLAPKCNGVCEIVVYLSKKGWELRGKDVSVSVIAMKEGEAIQEKTESLDSFWKDTLFSYESVWKGKQVFDMIKGDEYVIWVVEKKEGSVVARDSVRVFVKDDEWEESEVSDGVLISTIVGVARKEIGIRERVAEKKYIDCVGDCPAWCAYFVSWVYQRAGLNVPTIPGAQNLFRWFKKYHVSFSDPVDARAGDIVAWSRGGGYGHVGIVKSNDGKRIVTIEGNVKCNPGEDCVAEKSYSYEGIKKAGKGLLGFGRLKG